ncbi:hypothetical protein PYCCODRAFT_453539 [Trametes coccinea BRFM310]|uniref:Uncharacterized protein n=1 Tax=Trametes coccinea (strain BRFM310) TaxID=1353009 RepID=A0A1Y2IL71_TRAC3|nr:hypothetical protein PYCCODRAFT_453539 [Trametes coccinea BRFM310]
MLDRMRRLSCGLINSLGTLLSMAISDSRGILVGYTHSTRGGIQHVPRSRGRRSNAKSCLHLTLGFDALAVPLARIASGEAMHASLSWTDPVASSGSIRLTSPCMAILRNGSSTGVAFSNHNHRFPEILILCRAPFATDGRFQ